MADLEEHAFRRDRRFLLRLVLLVGLGGVVGLWGVGLLTSSEFRGCAARALGGDEPAPPAEPGS